MPLIINMMPKYPARHAGKEMMILEKLKNLAIITTANEANIGLTRYL